MSDQKPGPRVTAEPPEAGEDPRSGPPRPLYVAGLVGALWCVGIGLAVLTTITLIGWIAAPRTALGAGLPGVFRTVVNFWLVAHHAGFSSEHGRVGLLPLGLIVLPGALLYRSGAWMIRTVGMPSRPRIGVVHVAVALAVPYALLAGLLALAATSSAIRPSTWEGLPACFLVAFAAGALGAARAVVAGTAGGRRVRSGLGALLRLLPDRQRSLVVGVAGATGVLLASGAILVGGSLLGHMGAATDLYNTLAPGIVGGALLLLVELAFLPNAVIWGMAYAVGPGFSVGAGTSVSPTGVFLSAVPAFPPLAALPEPGPAPVVSLLALAAPFVAGAVGGVLTIRAMPSPVYEGAPLWGFVSGAMTGAVTALLTALSGGPLGSGGMATVGPSAWQVGLMATLEVGVSAAIAAWVTNWLILRRPVESTESSASGAAEPRERGRVRRRAEKPASAPPSKPTKAAKSAKPTKSAQPGAPGKRGAPAARAEPVRADEEAPVRPAAPLASPYASDPLEFEEAEPVLTPRRPARARGRAAEPAPESLPEQVEDPGPVPPEPLEAEEQPSRSSRPARPAGSARRPGPETDPDVPTPREDPERTETRGGAIYVLRDDPRRD
ncbi:cell division protein PerM [Actinomadura xylanilytica]|uniref:cell division protein PerM n=1 Tax=Actinomadura xylanilytica TaxID=887459 RepID=UPI00255B2C3A|nr:DUF6350 family protein [Actinomadura xylanilytica]MDL4776173.1 DUF6350 family protein [Actinomadura xylanilytica]